MSDMHNSSYSGSVPPMGGKKHVSPFVDALAKDIPTSATRKGVQNSEPNLPSGMPGPSSHLLPEKLRDQVDGE